MNETFNKQAFVVSLPHYQSIDNTVSVGDVEESTEPIEMPDVPIDVPVDDVTTGDVPDITGGDVFDGDITGGDVTDGDFIDIDISSGDISVSDIGGTNDGQDIYICTCTYKEKPLLWESDVTTYDTTDGLLLLILCVLLFGVFTRKDL